MTTDKDLVDFAVTVKRVTDAALLCDFGDGLKWVPRSVVEDGNELEVGYEGVIEIAEWFATKEGLV